MIAQTPPAGLPVPPPIAALAGRDRLRPVWRNELGGLTFEITGSDARRFAKWAPAGSGLDLRPEVARLRWAAGFTPVPRVLDTDADETGAWLLTAGLPGHSAVTPRWLENPGTAAAAIGRGLRSLHNRLPANDCPFSWSAEQVAWPGYARPAGTNRRNGILITASCPRARR